MDERDKDRESLIGCFVKTYSLHITPPSFEQVQVWNTCFWCRFLDFKVGLYNLCTKHNEIRNKRRRVCRYLGGTGKYVKGMGAYAYLNRGTRRRFSWFEPVNRVEYDRRIALKMIRERELAQKWRREIRKRRVKAGDLLTE